MVAGKGHKEQQIYKNKTLNISDRKIVKTLNIKPKIISKKQQNFTQNQSILKNILGKKYQLGFTDFR